MLPNSALIPACFAAQAGQEAIDAWRAASVLRPGGDDAACAELLSRGPLFVGVLISQEHQEARRAGAPLLQVGNGR